MKCVRGEESAGKGRVHKASHTLYGKALERFRVHGKGRVGVRVERAPRGRARMVRRVPEETPRKYP